MAKPTTASDAASTPFSATDMGAATVKSTSTRKVASRPWWHHLCQAWFGLVMLIFTTLLYVTCAIIHLLPMDIEKKYSKCCAAAHIFFKTALVLCPWIRVNYNLPWDKVFTGKGSAFVMLNHTSFLDGFLGSAILPLKDIATVRTMIKSGLLKIPIFGRICAWVGHFPVYFTSQKTGEFKVDAEKQAAVTKKTNTHIESGGHIVFFPEGQVGESPAVLQPFRRGGFAIVKQYNPSVWACVVKGAADTWPKDSAIGGYPAEIKIDLFEVFTKSEVASMKQEELCDEAQKRMQRSLDALYGKKN